ncbi:hypothetical protein THAOC_05607, partial [Thalassiosira oceanica]
KKVYAGEKGNLASLDFENNAIVDGGNEWINYVDIHSQNDDVDPVITDYSMDMLSDDHKWYNVHLAKVNRKKNDLLDAEREAKNERLAILASLIRNVYINEEWVAQEYLRRCKAGAWKPEKVLVLAYAN